MKFRYDKDTEKLIVSDSTRTEYHQIKIWLERYVKGYRFTGAFKMGVWNGKESYFDDGKINMGLWKECLKACKEIGVKFEIDNKEDFPLDRDISIEDLVEFCDDFFQNHKVRNKDGQWIDFRPHDYQVDTAFKILKNRYCMAEVATSGGKSLVIALVMFYILKNVDPDAKFLIIVPSITLVTQFYDDIISYYYGQNNIQNSFDYTYEIELENGDVIMKNPNDKITIDKKGEIDVIKLTDKHKIDGVSIKRIIKNKLDKPLRIEEIMSDKPRKFSGVESPNIYIGCYQSLEKWPKSFFQQFYMVACDEAHGSKSITVKSILKKTFGAAHVRFGVSGTFPADDTLEILTIQSVLGPKVTQIDADTLVKRGNITPMSIKVLLLNHDDKNFNTSLNIAKRSGIGKDVFNFEKQWIQNSEKRLNFIHKIVEKCEANTLILFHTIEYGHKILDKIKTISGKDFYYIDGEINNKSREEIKKQMEITNGNVKVLTASYGTVGTGWSVNAISNVIFADSFKSEQIVIQAIGRALRKHSEKKIANIFDLVDIFDTSMSNILYKHFLEREGFYKKRNYPYKIVKINL